MLLTEALYELLADKGIVSKEEVMERVRRLKAETTVNFRRVHMTRSHFATLALAL
jgi:hypothetical protein